MLQQPGDHVITTRGSLPNHQAASAAGEAGLLYYLCHSYARAKHLLKSAIVSAFTICCWYHVQLSKSTKPLFFS